MDVILELQRQINALKKRNDRLDTGRPVMAQITPLGGLAVKLTAGEALAEGEIVQITQGAGGADLTVFKNAVDGDMPIGAVYKAASINTSVWVVVSGVGYVLPDAADTTTRGYIIYSSASTAGRVDSSATIPLVALHNREVGHLLEGAAAGVKARAILHFN